MKDYSAEMLQGVELNLIKLLSIKSNDNGGRDGDSGKPEPGPTMFANAVIEMVNKVEKPKLVREPPMGLPVNPELPNDLSPRMTAIEMEVRLQQELGIPKRGFTIRHVSLLP